MEEETVKVDTLHCDTHAVSCTCSLYLSLSLSHTHAHTHDQPCERVTEATVGDITTRHVEREPRCDGNLHQSEGETRG